MELREVLSSQRISMSEPEVVADKYGETRKSQAWLTIHLRVLALGRIEVDGAHVWLLRLPFPLPS